MTGDRAILAEALRELDALTVAAPDLERLTRARDLLAALLHPDPEAAWPDNVDGDLK